MGRLVSRSGVVRECSARVEAAQYSGQLLEFPESNPELGIARIEDFHGRRVRISLIRDGYCLVTRGSYD